MIVKQELIRSIKDHFDLNIYETKVWVALLSKGIVTAGETAELSGVPRSRTYDVLESLEKKGFAVVKIGKPIKYIAVEPSVIIEKMKSNVMYDAQEKVKTLANLKGTKEYEELEQLHKTGISPIKVEEISGFIKGKSNAIARIRELFANASKEIAIYTSALDFEKKARVLAQLIGDAQKRNLKVKIALSGEPEHVKKINIKYNIKARHAEHKGKCFIADKTEILFTITPESAEEENSIWLKAPFFTESLDSLFSYQLARQ
ncbi:MAG: helix-turn-helix domain-containing protein [Nanoarchaeota archaeon]